jgi:hypothetical protein
MSTAQRSPLPTAPSDQNSGEGNRLPILGAQLQGEESLARQKERAADMLDVVRSPQQSHKGEVDMTRM